MIQFGAIPQRCFIYLFIYSSRYIISVYENGDHNAAGTNIESRVKFLKLAFHQVCFC